MRGFLLFAGVQVRSLLWSVAGGGRRRLLAAAAIGICLAALSVIYLSAVGRLLVGIGAGDALPLLAVLAASCAGAVFTFLRVPGTLFRTRDFDLASALPLRTASVVAARLVPLYAGAVVLAALFAGPLLACYVLSAPAAFLPAVASAVTVLLCPAVPVCAAVLLSCAVNMAAARFRHAGAASLILTALLVVAIFSLPLSMVRNSGRVEGEQLAYLLEGAASALEVTFAGAFPPALWAADAVRAASVAGAAANLLLLAGISAGALALTIGLMCWRYRQIDAAIAGASHAGKRARRVDRGLSSSGPMRALVTKELRRIGTLPVYAVNCTVGLILMVGLAAVLAGMDVTEVISSGVIDGLDIDAAQAAAARGQILAVLPWAFGFCGAMSLTAAPSVSLEGRSCWIMATLPVPIGTIACSKLIANLVLGGAACAVSCALLLVGGRVGVSCAIACAVVPFLLMTGVAAAALSLDLTRPNFSYIGPNDVIKRGLPMMAGAIGGIVLAAAGGLTSFWVSQALGSAAALAFDVAAALVVAMAGIFILCRACARTRFFTAR